MNTPRLISQMKHADIWFKNEFAQLLAAYNDTIGNESFFKDLIYKAVCANKLTPQDSTLDMSIPLEHRNFSFSPKILMDWTFSKKFNLPSDLITSKPDKNAPEESFSKQDKELPPRAESTYKNIIAALLEYIGGQTPTIDKHPNFINEAQLIETLVLQYKGYDGMSQSNLARKFPDARKNLQK